MDCSKFAIETAEAFNQVFNIGSGYGAAIFFLGFVLGALVFHRRSV